MCGLLEETTEHIFVLYGLAQLVWLAISIWCKVPWLFTFSVRDIVELYKVTNIPSSQRERQRRFMQYVSPGFGVYGILNII